MLIRSFAEIFMEIYNASAASILILMIGQILFMMRRVDGDLLKAKLFLNDVVMQHTWAYISIAGAALALNILVKFMARFTGLEENIKALYLVDLTQIVFLIAFLLMVYNWYMFIGGFVRQKQLDEFLRNS